MSSPPVRRPSAIIVDDEPLICRAMTRMLADDFDVTTYTGGGALLADLRDGAVADVIVSDMHLSDMTAIRLHARLLPFRPDLAERMIFVTGGSGNEPEVEQFLEENRDRVLYKPFRREALLAAVRRAMVGPLA